MAEDYSRRVARVAAAQMAELTGFEAAQESAVEILAELAVKYIQELCTAAHSYAELAHRTDFNISDLNLALSDMGTSMDDLRKYLDSWLAEQGPGSYDQGFVHPLPSEYPVRAPGRSLPSWEERREEAPAHIPSWLPAFPDRHTYVRTPAFPGHEEDPIKQTEVIRTTRRQAAKTTLTFKQQLLAVPLHPGDVPLASNPFLAVPAVEFVEPSDGAGRAAAGGGGGALVKEVVRPVSVAFEPVVGPVGEEGAAAGPGGAGGAAAGGEDRRRDMDATVKWQQVQEAQSGSSALGLPSGFTLDFATRVQRQALAFAPRRVKEDTFAARGGEELQSNRFAARARSSRYDIGDERKRAEHILAQAAEVKGQGGADPMFDD